MSLDGNELEFGPFRVDGMARRLYRGSETVALTGKTFELLYYMAQNPERVLLKKELMEAVWPSSFVEESNLSQNIFVLRKALGVEGSGLIETLPGRGYCFHAVVTSPNAVPMTALVETTETRVVYEEETEERLPFWRSGVALGFAVAAALLLGVAGWLGWQRYEDRVGGPPVQVVLADSEGGTGDAVLDRTLGNILRMDLAQSPFVTVLSASAVKQNMAQMLHKPDEALTLPIAREICERSGSQAVMHGTVAKAGGAYVLTEEATNCVDGTSLGEATQQVSRPDDLPKAIEAIAVRMRHDLGESRRTISRFNSPLQPATTGSLEALKDYTEAGRLGTQGKFTEAIEMSKQAVAIDPNFATAWGDMSIYEMNTLDKVASRRDLQKAYDLRQYATEPVQLFLTARYNGEITGDLYQSVANYKTWIDMYPRKPQPWSGLTEMYRQLGDRKEELKAAVRLRELLPTNAAVYMAQATAQWETNDLAGAKATCELAMRLGFDGDSVRPILYRLGYLLHDPKLVAEQIAWGKEHPNSPILMVNELLYAVDEGRNADVPALYHAMDEAFKNTGALGVGEPLRAWMAEAYWEFGEMDLAHKQLVPPPVEPVEIDALIALTDMGQGEKAEELLRTRLATQPRSTLWTLDYAPLVRGDALLRAHKPKEAIAMLEPTRQFAGRGYDGDYLLGLAYAEANELPQAEAEFRTIVDRPYIDPNAYQRYLAPLWLARVLVREGKKTEAAVAYRQFLGLSEYADGVSPLSKEARQELAAL